MMLVMIVVVQSNAIPDEWVILSILNTGVMNFDDTAWNRLESTYSGAKHLDSYIEIIQRKCSIISSKI